MLRFSQAYVLPAVKYALLILSLSLRYENEFLESIQRRFTKFLTGGGVGVGTEIVFMARLYNLGLLSLEFAQIKSDLIQTYKILLYMIGISCAEARLFLCTNNTRAKGLRLQQPFASSNVSASLFKFMVSHL